MFFKSLARCFFSSSQYVFLSPSQHVFFKSLAKDVEQNVKNTVKQCSTKDIAIKVAGKQSRVLMFWRHARIPRKSKVQVLNAMVFSKLRYGLCAFWLNAAERRRLDGFQNRCLRRIFSIQPAYFSRVSNAEVLSTAAQPILSDVLLRRQWMLEVSCIPTEGIPAPRTCRLRIMMCCLISWVRNI